MIVRGEGEVTIQAKIDGPAIERICFRPSMSPQTAADPGSAAATPCKDPAETRRGSGGVVDLYVPFDAEPGLRTGAIQISDGRQVPIELEILPFSLPRKATFFCEMNGYGLPDHVQDYYALQQVAYDHRVHANILHYSHNSAAPGLERATSICGCPPESGWTIGVTMISPREQRRGTGTTL